MVHMRDRNNLSANRILQSVDLLLNLVRTSSTKFSTAVYYSCSTRPYAVRPYCAVPRYPGNKMGNM